VAERLEQPVQKDLGLALLIAGNELLRPAHKLSQFFLTRHEGCSTGWEGPVSVTKTPRNRRRKSTQSQERARYLLETSHEVGRRSVEYPLHFGYISVPNPLNARYPRVTHPLCSCRDLGPTKVSKPSPNVVKTALVGPLFKQNRVLSFAVLRGRSTLSSLPLRA
jgi:hypothetical protein